MPKLAKKKISLKPYVDGDYLVMYALVNHFNPETYQYKPYGIGMVPAIETYVELRIPMTEVLSQSPLVITSKGMALVCKEHASKLSMVASSQV